MVKQEKCMASQCPSMLCLSIACRSHLVTPGLLLKDKSLMSASHRNASGAAAQAPRAVFRGVAETVWRSLVWASR